MLDTYTGDLLTTIEDALSPPTHLSPHQLGQWHAHTLRQRLPLIREALRLVHKDGDTELATQLIDQAIADHPDPPMTPDRSGRTARGKGSHLPSQFKGTPEGELPVPEHVLCALLHHQWAMTVEGKPPQETYVAYRPFGWTGEGDRFERITAPTRTELLRLLAHRQLGAHWIDPNSPTRT